LWLGFFIKSCVLYLTYDGVLEPLGESQVLGYLLSLADRFDMRLLSFEKSLFWFNFSERLRLRRKLELCNVRWYPCRYHKSPSAIATSWDVIQGIFVGLFIVFRDGSTVVHARSYISALIGLVLKRLTGVKLVFDMRGFWADERVDGGLWQTSNRIYRVTKWFERLFLRQADHIISLTQAGVLELESLKGHTGKLPPTTVIPTCADLNRFVPVAHLKDEKLIGYVGTVGTWYLFEPAARCFAELARRNASFRFLIINKGEHDFIRKSLERAHVPMDRVELRAASFDEMPALIATMSASIFFIKPVFSKKASAPTKLAELLGCGVPCLTNTGVGDMSEQLAEQNCGVTVSSFDQSALNAGVDALLQLMAEPDIVQRCRETALRHFSLEEGVKRYSAVYASLGLEPKRG